MFVVVNFTSPWAPTFNDELGHFCKHQEEPVTPVVDCEPQAFSISLLLLLHYHPSQWCYSLHGVTLMCDPKTTSSLSQRKGSFHLALCSHSLHVGGTKKSLKSGLCVTWALASRANQLKLKLKDHQRWPTFISQLRDFKIPYQPSQLKNNNIKLFKKVEKT